MVIRPNSQIYEKVEIKEYPNVVVVIPDIEHKVTRDWYGTTCIGTERTELSGRNRFPKGELGRAEREEEERVSVSSHPLDRRYREVTGCNFVSR